MVDQVNLTRADLSDAVLTAAFAARFADVDITGADFSDDSRQSAKELCQRASGVNLKTILILVIL